MLIFGRFLISRFFLFCDSLQTFLAEIEIPIKDMQGKFTFVKINEKDMCFGEKDIPIWWSFIFAEGPFFGKIRPCFHHPF